MEDNVTTILDGDKKYTIIGTAHVSKISADQVKQIIEKEKPDTVCVELCPGRLGNFIDEKKWLNTDILSVIKKKQAILLLINLIFASVQARFASKLGVSVGEEMKAAVKASKTVSARLVPVDRDIKITFRRVVKAISFFKKIKFLSLVLISMFVKKDGISKEEVESMKRVDGVAALLNELRGEFPGLARVLIDERDIILKERIKSESGNNIVAVVGAGHVPGIMDNWQKDQRRKQEEYEKEPVPKRYSKIIKLAIPAMIIGLAAYGIYKGDTSALADMAFYWIVINGIAAGIGAAVMLSHPLTIIAAVIAGPVTSLNPYLGAGIIAGLVEVYMRKPTVGDMQSIKTDIAHN